MLGWLTAKLKNRRSSPPGVHRRGPTSPPSLPGSSNQKRAQELLSAPSAWGTMGMLAKGPRAANSNTTRAKESMQIPEIDGWKILALGRCPISFLAHIESWIAAGRGGGFLQWAAVTQAWLVIMVRNAGSSAKYSKPAREVHYLKTLGEVSPCLNVGLTVYFINSIFILYWSIIDLQCCVSDRCIAYCEHSVSYMCVWVCVCIYISILFQILFPCKLSQSIE